MKHHLALLLACLLPCALSACATAKPQTQAQVYESVGIIKDSATGLITRVPTTGPTALQAARSKAMPYGMFIHFGINTFTDHEWTDGSVSLDKYAPKEIDADEWVLGAKNAGMTHVVLVCKHHDGFCNWPTKRDDCKYSVAHTQNKTDVVKAVSDACHKHGVHFAIYYSLWDRRWDRLHAADYKKDAAATNKAYVDYMVAQITELLTNYGPATELWLDGGWQKRSADWGMERVYDAVKRAQPACQVTANWTIGHPGNVDGKNLAVRLQRTGYPIRYFPSDFRIGDPHLPNYPDPKVFSHHGKQFYLPFEATVCLNNQWFWNSKDKGLKTVDALEALYYHTTGQGNLLLLNSPPGPDGHMRQTTLKRLVELRERLGLKVGAPFPKNVSVESKAKAEASSTWPQAGYDASQAVGENPSARWSAAADARASILTQTFAAPVKINRVLLREYESRIQSFVLEAQVDGAWKELAKGTQVGASKMFDFAPIQTTALRLRILEASEAPSIWSFWAFDTDQK